MSAPTAEWMKLSGNMSYEEFCEAMDSGYFTAEPNLRRSNQLQLAESSSDNNS